MTIHIEIHEVGMIICTLVFGIVYMLGFLGRIGRKK